MVLSRQVERREDRTRAALAGRVEALDAADHEWPGDVRSADDRDVPLLAHFMAVMSRWTDAVVEQEAGAGAAIEPSVADALARGSRLLANIERHHPSLISRTNGRGSAAVDPERTLRIHWRAAE